MTRTVTLALAMAAASLFANAANAQGYYSATPTTAPTKASLIVDGTMWKCDGGGCSAAKTTSRDAIVCEKVAKRVGVLTMFKAGATSFDEPALAKCNTRAK